MNNNDHYAVINILNAPITVKLGDTVLAKASQVLELTEHAHGKAYPAVLYFPRESIAMQHFSKVEGFTTHCPIKGDASYYDLELAGGRTEKAVWSYEDPLPENAAIKNHLAFDLGKLDLSIER